MAAALLSRSLAAAEVTATVTSAGLFPGGREPPTEVISTMAAQGLDLRGHRSRALSGEMVAGADLVLGMAREHVREVVALHPDAWSRTFTLKELVRRATELGPRADGQALGEWLETLQAGRTRLGLLGSSPHDDVADPVGCPSSAFQATATNLELLVSQLVQLCWPR